MEEARQDAQEAWRQQAAAQTVRQEADNEAERKMEEVMQKAEASEAALKKDVEALMDSRREAEEREAAERLALSTQVARLRGQDLAVCTGEELGTLRSSLQESLVLVSEESTRR